MEESWRTKIFVETAFSEEAAKIGYFQNFENLDQIGSK